MTTKQIIDFNERLALEKIRAAFAAGDLRQAEHLKVMGICDKEART